MAGVASLGPQATGHERCKDQKLNSSPAVGPRWVRRRSNRLDVPIDQETATQLIASGGTQMGAQADSGCSRSRNEVPIAKLEKLMASDAQGDS
jgi:hypothetical protein